MTDWLEENKVGKKKINYKIREWIFARQRYWGEPVPIVHMDDGTIHVLDDKELPLVLHLVFLYNKIIPSRLEYKLIITTAADIRIIE